MSVLSRPLGQQCGQVTRPREAEDARLGKYGDGCETPSLVAERKLRLAVRLPFGSGRLGVFCTAPLPSKQMTARGPAQRADHGA